MSGLRVLSLALFALVASGCGLFGPKAPRGPRDLRGTPASQSRSRSGQQ